MLNTKVIVLSGFARGGTNLAWNILQSHPTICSPIYETGQLFSRNWLLQVCRLIGCRYKLCKSFVDKKLFEKKLDNLKHTSNKYKYENQLYTQQEVQNAALCLKSVNYDINITDALLKIYPRLYLIAITRNGYALCDGYLRRKRSIKDAARLYVDIANKIRKFQITIPKLKIVKFEDMISNPFKLSEELFSFLRVEPTSLDTLRLKSKKAISTSGEHKTLFGHEHRKYWFDKNSIKQLIDPTINHTQINRLTKGDIVEFNSIAKEAIHFFGYDIL